MKTKLPSPSALALAAVLSMAGATAHANLLVNGGFESGDLSGWTLFGTTDDGIDPYIGVTGEHPQAGSFGAFAGPFGATGGISQTLSTVIGGQYLVDFWLASDADAFGTTTPNSFVFSWGGNPVLSLVNAGAFGYTHYAYSFVATKASTAVAFTFENDPAFYELDSVVVAVPEPSSYALLGVGGLAALMARRRLQAANGKRTKNV